MGCWTVVLIGCGTDGLLDCSTNRLRDRWVVGLYIGLLGSRTMDCRTNGCRTIEPRPSISPVITQSVTVIVSVGMLWLTPAKWIILPYNNYSPAKLHHTYQSTVCNHHVMKIRTHHHQIKFPLQKLGFAHCRERCHPIWRHTEMPCNKATGCKPSAQY